MPESLVIPKKDRQKNKERRELGYNKYENVYIFFNKKGAISFKALFVGALFVIGFFWFLGKETREVEHLSFSNKEEELGGQAAEILLAFGEGATTTDSVPNKTIEFAGGLVSTYLNPAEISSQETTKISSKEDLIKILKEIAPTVSYYREENLVITKDQEEIKMYGERFFSSKKDLFFDGLGDEALIYTKTTNFSSSQEEREFAIGQLRKSAEIYKKLSERLIKIPIPENKKEEHLTYVNMLVDFSLGSEYLANGLLDQLYSLIGVHFYQKGALTLAKFK